MQTIRNFRDLGGITSEYGVVKKHKLLRGGPLNNLNEQDKTNLLNHNALKLVVDFRNTHEINNERNMQLDGVYMENIVIMKDEKNDADPNVQIEKASNDNSSDFMYDIYESFVLDANARASYKYFIEQVARYSKDGSVFYHCTAGKDRTGFASALLLKLLGVSDEEIYRDFLRTNENIEKSKESLLPSIQKFYPFDETNEELLLDVLGVRKEFLDTSFKAIEETYENFDNFIKAGLGIDEDTITTLRNNILDNNGR